MRGWIKLHRGISEHWIMNDAEYLRAWVVILMQVNHKETKVMIKKKLLLCGIGESLNSLDTWGKLFGNWSKGKTKRFLDSLKSEQMIDLKSERVTTRLTVCNYTSYQDARNADETQTNPQADPQTERRRDTNKNDKNDKNDKKTTLEDRIEVFKNNIREASSSRKEPCKPSTLKEFFDYWSTIGDGEKKMMFEKTKSFNTGRRLTTWVNNNFNGTEKETARAVTTQGTGVLLLELLQLKEQEYLQNEDQQHYFRNDSSLHSNQWIFGRDCKRRIFGSCFRVI